MSSALMDNARRVLADNPALEKSLNNYAHDIGVSLDHVVLGILQMVAEEYDNATGNGIIPCLY